MICFDQNQITQNEVLKTVQHIDSVFDDSIQYINTNIYYIKITIITYIVIYLADVLFNYVFQVDAGNELKTYVYVLRT